MKVTEVTPDKIVIRSWPWPWMTGVGMPLATLIFATVQAVATNHYRALIVCAVAAVFLVVFAIMTTVNYLVLTISRLENLVSWRHLTPVGCSHVELSLDSLIEANVFNHASLRSKWWIAILAGRLPPTLVLITHKNGEPTIHHVKGWVSGYDAIVIANAINEWLHEAADDTYSRSI